MFSFETRAINFSKCYISWMTLMLTGRSAGYFHTARLRKDEEQASGTSDQILSVNSESATTRIQIKILPSCQNWVRYGLLVLNLNRQFRRKSALLLTQNLQECIPVGCVLPTCWPHPSMHCTGGGCLPRVCLPRGVSVQGGVCPVGCIPACNGADPAVDRQTPLKT